MRWCARVHFFSFEYRIFVFFLLFAATYVFAQVPVAPQPDKEKNIFPTAPLNVCSLYELMFFACTCGDMTIIRCGVICGIVWRRGG
jgi:hypothetical protein